MLEQPSLLIQRRDSGWIVLDPVSHRLLGKAPWQSTVGTLGTRWLARPALQVFEAEDEPLLFTVRKLWAFSTKWEICDADANVVAVVRDPWVVDALGQRCAFMERTAQGTRFRGNTRDFAAVTEADDETILAFAPELQGEPILKMALLGALLVSRA